MGSTLHKLFERLENLLVKSFGMAAEDVLMEDREEVDWNLFLLVREIAQEVGMGRDAWEASPEARPMAEDRAAEPPASERAVTPERRRAASEEDGA